jgi:glycosyltransferase involved in cell wall biosynthesis
MENEAPLRIAMVAPPWFEIPPEGYGGIEDMVATLTAGLSQRGHEVTLVAAGEDRTDATFVPTFPTPPEGLGGPDTTAIELIHAQRTNERLREIEHDIVHDHSTVGPLFAPHREHPTVMTVHGPVTGWMKQVYRELRSVHLVAISSAQRASGPDLPWIGTVYNGIEVASFPLIEEKEDHVVFLGRMNPEKGVAEAIEVARRIGRKLLIAAKCDEEDEEKYFEEHIRPHLSDNAIFIGDVDGAEKREFLGRASALLFPIQWEEPFGLVMIEAMACGTPVLATRRGSVPEVVDEGVTGFVAEDLDGIVEAYARVGELTPIRIRERAFDRFDGSRMTDRYEAVYRTALEGGYAAGAEEGGEPVAASD